MIRTMLKPVDFFSGAAKADDTAATHWAREVAGATGWQLYPRSLTVRDTSLLFLGRKGRVKTLGILYQGASGVASGVCECVRGMGPVQPPAGWGSTTASMRRCRGRVRGGSGWRSKGRRRVRTRSVP